MFSYQYLRYPYIDGYEMFNDLPEEELIGKYWLPWDGHWQKPGSDLFADKLANYILETNWVRD